MTWTTASPASESLHHSASRSGAMMFLGAAVCIAAAIWVFYLGVAGTSGLGPHDFFLIGVGCALALLSVFAINHGSKLRMPPLSAVGVSDSSLVLRWTSGDDTVLRWNDRSFRIGLTDMRNYRPAGQLVSSVRVFGRYSGVSTEAIDAILAGALAHGLAIKSRPWKGSWGEVGRYTLSRQGDG
jgi:hypothetical protein